MGKVGTEREREWVVVVVVKEESEVIRDRCEKVDEGWCRAEDPKYL